MSVERDDAIINEAIIMRTGFRFDRTGSLFDPDSISKVEIRDSDHTTVLETIESGAITKSETGVYFVTSSTSWNTSSRKVFDRWFIVKDGVDYELDNSTFIRSEASTADGISSFVSLVKLKVQSPTIGNVKLADPADYETIIQEAIKLHSQRKPKKKVAKLTGSADAFFSLPSDWEDEFSWILNIEYPLSQFPPCFIQQKFYRVEEIDTGLICRFYESGFPGVNEDFYFRYYIRHTVDDDSSTIPLADKDSVANLAASICCQSLAEAFGQTSDSTIDADVINYRSRGDEFASRAKELFRLYDKAVKPITTGFIGEWDIESYWLHNGELLLKGNKLI